MKEEKILIFGGTGYIGKHMVNASMSLGHPTFVYTRPLNSQTHPSKLQICDHFKSMGVTLLQGELEHHQIVAAIQQVDIVISTLAYPQVLDQLKIIHAIKLAGCDIKRFIPSDFGVEEDKIEGILAPFEDFLDKKREIRRATEAAAIPYTFVSSNCYAEYFLNLLLRPHHHPIAANYFLKNHHQHNNILVYGNGEARAILNDEEDIAMYTIKAANDPRTHNRKIVYRPSKNIVSQNDLIALWERKAGCNFNRIFVPEQHLVNLSHSLPCPHNIPVSILHSVFVRGDLVKFEIDEDEGYVEASKLYPDYNYKSIDQLLDLFLLNPPPPAYAAFE